MHYDDCTNAALKNEAICTKNIPSSNAKRCKWTGSSCSLDDRKCNNFIEYSDSKDSNLPCHSLAHDAQKICYYNKNQCIETYAECEKYTGTDSTTCQNIIPLKKANDADEGSYAPDPLNKCEMELKQCKEKPRVCTDYKKRNDDADTLCTQLKSEKDSTNGKAHCILSGEDCKDVYSSCENYNLLVTNENDRDENECKSIPTNDYNKCTFENKQCKTEKKKCEEIIKDTVCTSHTLDDDKKKCIFKSNSCKEEFKNCDSYNGYHSSDPTNIEKNVCEAITPLYDGELRKYKCVYKDTDGTKTCEKKLKECEEYEGNDKDLCESLSTSDSNIYSCKLINNKCVTQYKNCYIYSEQIKAGKAESNKTTCESILLLSTLYRCFYKNDKYCEELPILCSEAEDQYSCASSRSLNKNKKCSFENGKCVEKYDGEDYNYCTDYRGTDKDICISIKPYGHDSYNIDYSSRCEYKNNECVRVSKKCEEAKDENECGTTTPTDTNKNCVFTNNKCVEQYKTCNLYNGISGTIDEEVCESIILKGFNSNEYLTKKCKYTPSVGEAKATCTEETRECSDFKIEFYKNQCTSINPTDRTKKCMFSNNSCSAVLRTCSELSNLSGATDEECGKTSTSPNKRCVAKGDRSGCEEVDKSNENENGNGNENENGKNRTRKSYGGKKYINKIIFILLCLLV